MLLLTFLLVISLLCCRRHVSFCKDVQGATAIEYALIASMIAMVAIGGMRLIGNKILGHCNNVVNGFNPN